MTMLPFSGSNVVEVLKLVLCDVDDELEVERLVELLVLTLVVVSDVDRLTVVELDVDWETVVEELVD